MLTARSLVKHFGTAPALDGVDFGVAPGESVAVTGPSGSGKSTLLHCLAGIMRPDAGEVRLFDERIDALSERQRSHLRRTRFAFLFQFGQLLPELPAEENVALPLMLGGMPRRAALEPARAELRRLGLEGKEGRRPGELSGGEAQRVALARALVVRPAVVFADEPTGALDRTTGDQVMGVLLDTVAELDAALVVVTHDPRIAARCTRTIEIRDGRLSGTPRTGNGERGGFEAGTSGAGAVSVAPQGSRAGSGVAGQASTAAPGFESGRVTAQNPAGAVGRGGDAFASGESGAAVPGSRPNRETSGPAGSNPGPAGALGRGGDAFASGSGASGAGPFGHEPVAEVWR
jgi:putative ABC transport system ATP-binding protein